MHLNPKYILTVGTIFIAVGIVVGISHLNKVPHDTSKPYHTTQAVPIINWRKPSENKPYPDVNDHPDMWIKVSKAKQRVYLIDHGKVLYTMYCSTGVGDDTPTGTYHIQAERGLFFYNEASGEGARYWVSWKDHGVYLFHTVPTDKEGNYIKSEAKYLGKSPHSHGCVRLSVPDAKWFYEHIKEGTKVVITNN